MIIVIYDQDLVFDMFWPGFGLFESGSVSMKNEVNIMVKNMIDVIFGGLSFWAFGFAFAFGDGEYSNPFCGWGNFLALCENDQMGALYSKFFFQASFATTATTIVSGNSYTKILIAHLQFHMLFLFFVLSLITVCL